MKLKKHFLVLFIPLLLLALPFYSSAQESDLSNLLAEDPRIITEEIAQENEVNISEDATFNLEISENGDLPLNDKYYRGEVTEVIEEGIEERFGEKSPYQVLRIEILSGDEKGKSIVVEQGKNYALTENLKSKKGDKVTILKTDIGTETEYFVTDKYRLNSLLGIFLFFFLLVVSIARFRGFMSILGFVFSFIVLTKLILPLLIAGYNPFWVSLGGACLIALFSIYLAHGFNRRSTIALISTFITLFFAIIMAVIFVDTSHLLGFGTEEAFYVSKLGNINLKGLLLGGIIIGVLGVLDDITTAQVATVYEIKRANMSLPFHEVYKRSLSVGKEHINALVNTLVLAYAGASLPLFLLFYNNEVQVPFWVTLNSEIIAEEIVRTLVGSIALIMAVPITTALAAWYFSKKENVEKIKDDGTFHACGHSH